MPKRPNQSTTGAQTTESQSRKSSQKGSNAAAFWHESVSLVKSRRFHFAMGLVLLCLVVYCLLSYISYFFTGAEDFSALGDTTLSGRELRDAIGNRGGVIGARMQDRFVDRAFGIPVVALLVMGVIYSLQLLRAHAIPAWKTLLHCSFWLVWGSVTMAFLQYAFSMESSFFRWGGSYGEALCNLLLNTVQWIGTLLIVLAVVLVYFIGISPKTIPAIERCCAWIANLFKRKPKAEEEGAPLDEGGPFVDINGNGINDLDEPIADGALLSDGVIDLTNLTDATPAAAEQNTGTEPVLTIEGVQTDEIEDITPDEPEEDGTEPATDAAEVAADNQLPNAAENLTIEETVVNETQDENEADDWSKQGPYDPRADLENYRFPALDLLKVYDNENAPIIDQEEQKANANRIVTTLRNYGVEIDSIKATVGPTVTLYEVVPKAGVRISKIQSLEQDIMLTLSAVGIRIIAPMPGKGTVGIEVPNERPQTVSMHSVVASRRFQEEKKMRLPIALGRTITNEIFMFDLAKTPHLLVAGATGQGKSVAINAIITSLLYKKHPAELKMVLVDPKMVEFAPYKPLIRHFLAAQPDTADNDVIITDCSKVIDTLNSLVIEMENRYKLLMDAGVRNLEDYNDKFVARRLNPAKLVDSSLHHRFLPYIVIVIDEYGDFIMQAGKHVEQPIARITQKARAVGMHMILATQRPSVNIVTGVIKANIPTRIALRTQSVVDSRTVLDAKGADQLIGRGDLLYSGSGNITRVQCAFVDTPEVDAIVEHVERQQHYFAPYELPEYVSGEGEGGGESAPGSVDLKKLDPMFVDVARYVVANQQGSTSVLQRKFEIGYNRAGKLSDQLEAAGIVGPAKGPKGRDVLIQDEASLMEVFRRLDLM